MRIKRLLKTFMLGGASSLALATSSYAACPNPVNNTNLGTETCAADTIWNSGFLSIQAGSTVSGTNTAGTDVFSSTGSSLSYFLNNGILSAPVGGFFFTSTTLDNFTNNGTINAAISNLNPGNGVSLDGSTISNFNNSGTISANLGLSNAIELFTTSNIGQLNNSGTISGPSFGVNIDDNTNIIGTITNTGSITGGNGIAIRNNGQITTLNNYQGVNGSGGSALTITNNLPQNYNVILNGTGYGQLSASNSGVSTTTFGVSSLTDTRRLIQGQIYSSVLSGVSAANLNNTTGKVGDRGTFTLKQNGATTWDMSIDGLWTPFIGYMNPSVSNTYAAATANRDAVSGALHQRYAVLNAVMEYDCSRFDKHNICLSFQARSTGWGDQTTGAGVFNIAYRATDKIRAGVYLDYQAAQATPFATNSYSGGIQWGYNNPTFGGYVGFSDKPDGTGIQARLSGGYNPGKLTINRAALDYSEPGTGTARLNAYYAYGLAGYGVSVGNGVIITPYGGLRYTDVTRNAYTEQFNPIAVLFPLAYNAYYEQLITGLTGAKVQAMLTDKFGVSVGFGGEFDFSRNANSYSGTSLAPGMQVWGVEHGGSWNGVRPAGLIGAFYDVNKNDRLMLNAYVGEQAWSSRTYTTLLAGYQVAF